MALYPFGSKSTSTPPLIQIGILAAFVFIQNVMAQETPGMGVLKLYSGEGTFEIITADKTVREIPGELSQMSVVVRKGEMIRTGADGSVVLLKGDDVGILLGKDTIVDTTPDIKAGHSLSLLKGKLNVTVRPLKDRRPARDFRLKMPTMVLAVKGTNFFAEVAGGIETGGVNAGKIEAVRLIDEKERKAPVTRGNAIVLNRDGAARMRRLSREEEIRYKRFYESLEKGLADKSKPSEPGFVELCWIPPGKFKMGSPESGPQVNVELTKGFWIGKYEVTQGEYTEVMGANPSKFKESGKMAPVEMITSQNASDFCKKLTERYREEGVLPDGWIYTLPTEAQWEFACRAGSTTAYSFGDDAVQLKGHAWFGENSGKKTHPVGGKKSNARGLYDMHGNVWEYCRNWWGDSLSGGKDPEGPESGTWRVYRGGSWLDSANYCRSAYRHGGGDHHTLGHTGFRVVLVHTGKVSDFGRQ